MSSNPEPLGPSDLGTKAYWDQAYEKELDNFAHDPADEGTIWFSESKAEEKVREQLSKLSEEGVLRKDTHESHDATTFLDLGTGNGHMLLALRESGWKGKMLGVDYSDASVKLARRIEEKWRTGELELDVDIDSDDETGEDPERREVMFQQADILSIAPQSWLGEGFDVVLDKGTFDAISLNAEEDVNGQRRDEVYQTRVEKMVKSGGFLIVVSCNWTEDELRSWLVKGELEEYGKIDYPSFQFGGQKGSQICTLLFRRRVL